MGMKGPVGEKAWARIWAHAFLDDDFRALFEHSPREAVIAFLGEAVIPLYLTEDQGNHKAPMCIKKVYKALEALRDDPAKKQKVVDLMNGEPGIENDKDIKPILDDLHGNEWQIGMSGAANPFFTKGHSIDHPSTPNNALVRLDWGRVYAKAVLDEINFKPLLQKDPALGVREFARLHGHPHALEAPILKLSTFLDLHNAMKSDPDVPADLKDMDNLRALLHRIETGIEEEYEAVLKVCLSC